MLSPSQGKPSQGYGRCRSSMSCCTSVTTVISPRTSAISASLAYVASAEFLMICSSELFLSGDVPIEIVSNPSRGPRDLPTTDCKPLLPSYLLLYPVSSAVRPRSRRQMGIKLGKQATITPTLPSIAVHRPAKVFDHVMSLGLIRGSVEMRYNAIVQTNAPKTKTPDSASLIDRLT